MSNIRIDLNDEEAELLYQALLTVIQASSPDLMRQYGWEGANEITAATLIQSIFDVKDIETLSSIAAVMAPQVVAPTWDYSAHDIQDSDTAVWSGDPLQFHGSAFVFSGPIPETPMADESNNIVDLNSFRNRKKDNTL